MSGLDPNSDVILEVGMVAYDTDLRPGDSFHRILRWPAPRKDMVKRVEEMHTANGLLADISDPNLAIDHVRCGREMKRWLDELEGKPILCGNSVHVDRSFIASTWPECAKRFHHRHLDISSIRRMFNFWGPDGETLKRLLAEEPPHRVMGDIRRCVTELRGYILQLQKSGFRSPAIPDDFDVEGLFGG